MYFFMYVNVILRKERIFVYVFSWGKLSVVEL